MYSIKEVKRIEKDKANSRIYCWLTGENVMEQLVNRKHRPFKVWKELLVKELSELAGMELTWDQYAGCTCPCSPGFVVKGVLKNDEYPDGFDLHVTMAVVS